jgi:hypothetical protein
MTRIFFERRTGMWRLIWNGILQAEYFDRRKDAEMRLSDMCVDRKRLEEQR